MNSPSIKYLILLHIVVLIFGFTGILGKLISIPSELLVWYRMLIASVSLAIYIKLRGKSLKLKKEGRIKVTTVGFIIAAHWIFFFEAIKQSNVSITLAALATASIFTALLEPLFFKRKIHYYELFLGALVLLGLYFIFQFETDNATGIILGVIAAFLASLFTVINGKLIKQYDSERISLYELSGGVLAISIYFLLGLADDAFSLEIPTSDLLWLLVLGVICTAFAFVASVEVMKELTPFTVSLSINLEPVYGIILAFLIFGEEEKMSLGFYLGTILILSSIFVNVWLKRRARKRAQKAK
ncbi:MAG: EamA family transporter [Flavobacteriales bacterium]|nr:EamA family transporter [Flavobacteriales bacterium]